MIKCVLDGLFHLFGEHSLHVLADEFPVDSVAVRNREEVRPSVLSKMRQDQEGVLIGFVWILRRIASFGGECKLCYTIVKLLTRLPWLDGVLILGS